MAEHDYKGAIIAFADFLATGTPTLRRTVSGSDKIDIFAFDVNEADAAEKYTIVRPYSGIDTSALPTGSMSVQLFTVAATDVDAMLRAQLIHGRLLDADKRPLRGFTQGQFVFHGITGLRAPAIVGRRDGKVEYASNMDVFFRKAA